MPELLRYPIAWLFGYRGVPFAIRGIFRQELFHIFCWGIVWGCLNGGFCGYVALRGMGASDLLVSIIAASMAFANLFAVGWATQIRRMSKHALISLALAITTVVLFSFALTPLCDVVSGERIPGWLASLTSQTYPLTATVFTLQIVLAWIAMQGTNTVRTSIWRLNYPDRCRGRILARFAVWQILIGSLWVAVMGAYFDGEFSIKGFQGQTIGALDLSWLPGAGRRDDYRILFPLAGVAGILSIVFYQRVKIREPAEPSVAGPAQREGTEVLEPNFSVPGWFVTRWGVLRAGLAASFRVLKTDKRFREYMSWLFLSGSAMMMIHVPFVLILNDVFDINYMQAAALLTLVPQVILVLATPLWARLFDRWTIFRFRSFQLTFWAASRFILAYGVFHRSMAWVMIAVAVSGVALAGGRFAWQLGHMNFSSKSNDSLYMGIHQTLTGVRGLIMPFAGALLYRHVLDWHIIWITGVALIVASLGFWKMHRRTRD